MLAWLGDAVGFGDSEIVELTLQRDQPSRLVIDLFRPNGSEHQSVRATFFLVDVLVVQLEGFSHQNVIGGLFIKPAVDRQFHESLRGIGVSTPDHEIKIEPCAGAFGEILATIESISLSPA